jgi:hypothetical protein
MCYLVALQQPLHIISLKKEKKNHYINLSFFLTKH